jgi:hypothetical protein
MGFTAEEVRRIGGILFVEDGFQDLQLAKKD